MRPPLLDRILGLGFICLVSMIVAIVYELAKAKMQPEQDPQSQDDDRSTKTQ